MCGNNEYPLEPKANGEVTSCDMAISFYDEEEIHENCTVQILKNSETGEISIGWWENGD